jgi:hypothetical protein
MVLSQDFVNKAFANWLGGDHNIIIKSSSRQNSNGVGIQIIWALNFFLSFFHSLLQVSS